MYMKRVSANICYTHSTEKKKKREKKKKKEQYVDIILLLKHKYWSKL